MPSKPPIPLALRVATSTLLLFAAVFFLLHFSHLRADFPNHSPWIDWSKYTDEGWYGDAAIRHFQLGHWNLPGDFNPAAALPLWPFLEALLFRVTGVSLVAVRALTVCVFGGILVASYLLLRRLSPASGARTPQLSLPFAPAAPARSLAPALAVALLAVSPFCFVFTRLAILEPMLVLLTLLALHAALAIPSPAGCRLGPSILLGLLLTGMVLTKTTGVFLFPAVFYLLWSACGYRASVLLRAAAPAATTAALTWGAYFFLLVRPHFLADYRYLFSANAYTGITFQNAAEVLHNTVKDGLWIGGLLYPLSILAMFLAVARPGRLRREPLIPTLILWATGYAAFLAYHNNIQPRYYLVPAVPLTLLVAVVFEPAWRMFRPAFHPTHSRPAYPVVALAATFALAAVLFFDARKTLGFVRNPEYTLVDAATNIANIVRQDPTHSRLVLSISGSDLSLMTGIPSIDDDFGTLELADRVKKYRPGWYAAWNEIDDDKMDALSTLFHPVRVASFPAMDDPDRNLLILYRLDDKNGVPRVRKTRKPIPRPLQTRIGQQPSLVQLEH